MKALPFSRTLQYGRAALPVLAILAIASIPASAQGGAPADTGTTVDIVFRWLNFALVIGTLIYLVAKFGTPYFKGRAQTIAGSIEDAGRSRQEAEREFQIASHKLANVDAEIEQERQAARADSAADRERIQRLTRVEVEKIHQAGSAEVAAAERVGAQQLRTIGAKLATERAARLIRERMSGPAEAALFDAFVGELERVTG